MLTEMVSNGNNLKLDFIRRGDATAIGRVSVPARRLYRRIESYCGDIPSGRFFRAQGYLCSRQAEGLLEKSSPEEGV